MSDRGLTWVVVIMVIATVIANLAAVGVIFVAVKVTNDDIKRSANHGAFCQYLYAESFIDASHPALEPLLIPTQAALRSEHC